ncbi:Protein NPP-8 b [Aphelenchoides avenae]|nr:Protein NPP-8 b [Aphelenchus avenae]
MKCLTLIGYKKKAGEADQAVVNATRRRNAAYASITDALDYLQSCTQGHVPSKEKRLNAARAKTERDALLQKVFDSDDELANVAVFRWMMKNGLADTLTQRRSRFFEEFLYHEIDRGESCFRQLLRNANSSDLAMNRLDKLLSVNRYDKTVVEDTYGQLLKNELDGFERGDDTDKNTLRKVVSQLKKFRERYITTPRFFPAEFILSELLMFSLKSTRPEWLPQLCHESGISQNDLLAAVMHKYRNDPKAHQFVTRLCVYVCNDFVVNSCNKVKLRVRHRRA